MSLFIYVHAFVIPCLNVVAWRQFQSKGKKSSHKFGVNWTQKQSDSQQSTKSIKVCA